MKQLLRVSSFREISARAQYKTRSEALQVSKGTFEKRQGEKQNEFSVGRGRSTEGAAREGGES